jgi:ketosteroid isomerase-like protein
MPDFARQAVLDGMRNVFATGARVEILERSTVELFTHGDAAYEIARAVEVFAAADGTRVDTSRSNMFVQWIRGPDGRWLFNRALISPVQ